jgi:hypothetical protein
MTVYTKICTKCDTLKPITEFHKNKSKKDGYSSNCKKCVKEYQTSNKESINLVKKIYRENNKECIIEYNKNYYEDNINYFQNYYAENKEKIKQYAIDNKENRKKWKDDNKEIINKKRRERHKIRKNIDKIYLIRKRVRSLIGISFKRSGFLKSSRTHKILGCSYEEFHTHIENQFMEGMNWDNRDKWHLDHITPISWGTTEEEIISLNHYTNFQPLWAVDNINKSNKFSG